MNLSLMTDPRFGYSYPAGAEEDPLAPWNEEDSDEDWEEDSEDSEADD